jgi:hypothetical protein
MSVHEKQTTFALSVTHTDELKRRGVVK